MTKTEIANQALSLPVEERLDLAQELWESAAPSSPVEVSPELKQLLENRRRDALEDPDAGIPWDQAKASILERL